MEDYYNHDPKADNDYNQENDVDGNQNNYKPSTSNNTGLAITSLVLGICSIAVCMGPLTGIPGIICGHIARAKASKGTAGGAGMALGGLITGYIGTVLGTLYIMSMVAIMFPAINKAQNRAREIQCRNNLKQIGMGLIMYAADNRHHFPPYDGAKGLELLRSNGYIEDTSVFKCPLCDTTPAAYGQPITETTCDYNYKGGGRLGNSNFYAPIAWDKKHNHEDSGNAVFDDGHVETKKGLEWEKILNDPSSPGENQK